MKNILIITPRFSPVNAADQHRVRMALSFFSDFDWRAEVLCIAPKYTGNDLDQVLLRTIPGDTVIHQAQALPAKITHFFGLGSLALRSYPFLKYFGDSLLRQRAFDLIFISTTEFVLFALGVHWRRKFGIPFVVDFQDPWLCDYYEQPGSPLPPGGRLKYRFSQMLAQWLEPKVMRQVAKTVCVSPAYPRMLQNRYPYLHDDHFATIPFGASVTDIEVAKQVPLLPYTLAVMLGSGRNWCYIGVVPDSMQFALRAFFGAFHLARKQWPDRFGDVKLFFVGTDYAPSGQSRQRVMPLAEEFGLGDVVVELTDRVPYFSALRLMLVADALIVLGSDDSGYTASKIYPCILAKKALLAIFHQDSSVVEVMDKTKAGVCVSFSGTSPADMEVCSEQIISRWFKSGCEQPPVTDWAAFEPYTAREMTKRLCAVFDSALESST